MKNYIIYHYHFDKVAGTERVLYNIIKHLTSSSENRVTLLLLSEQSPLVFDIDKLPIHIVYLNIKKKSNKFLYFLDIYKFTKKYFIHNFQDQEKIILTTNYVLGLVLYKATLSHNTKIVSCEHFSVKATGRFSHLIRKMYYKHINVVMLTKSDADYVKSRYQPKKCVTIPNAIPFETCCYHKNETKRIIAIGRYTYQKGFDLLIESFARIHNLFPDWKLQIIGEDFGSMKLMLRLINENKIKNIELLPSTPSIQDYYKQASFLVMSSRFEGLPMVLLEAIGYGLPIVSFNCPTGPKEVVDESNGFLVENGNIEELADSMLILMRNRGVLLDKAKGSEDKANIFSKTRINKMWDEFFKTI